MIPLNESVSNDDYIREVVDKYSDMLFKIAFLHMKSRSDAEDITQDVFLKLIEKTRYFESDEHLKAFLIRVTINLCKDRPFTKGI